MITVKTVADLNRAIVSNIWRLDADNFDVVVGVPRSGMLPAGIIATHLQLPFADMHSFARGVCWSRSGHVARPGSRILLVDDTSNRGEAMARAVKSLRGKASKITRLAVYGPYRDDTSIIDIFFEECPGPRAFQWNMAKHARLPRWGFDFDGVLCRDPDKFEDDRGEEYDRFLEHAEPLFRPRRPIGHIITCRQERYREQTEAWLRKHGVQYLSLTMSPRHRNPSNKGLWKAAMIQKFGRIEMFIESELKQARVIAETAKIPVFCMAMQEVINP